jgi:exonuclease III
MATIATWNLHQMGRQVTIPDGVSVVIERVKPDVLVLTEWVDRGRRADFRHRLLRAGYAHVTQTAPAAGQNQVLVASLVEHEDGVLVAPDVDQAAATNFRHVFLPSMRLHVAGLRVPHYQSERPVSPAKLVHYWRQLTRKALENVSQKAVFIGDFNVGDGNFDAAGKAALRKLVKAGYRMCTEADGLDRALVSGALTVRSFSVIESVAGYRLTGNGGLSDHAMLLVDVA